MIFHTEWEALTMAGSSTTSFGGAATGVILSAVYALNLYRRVMFGEIVNPELKTIADLDKREILIFAPLIIGTLVLGVYPNLIFNLTASSVDGLVGAWRAAVGG
jgi:NADH-quinone oxidoreductase subunit M